MAIFEYKKGFLLFLMFIQILILPQVSLKQNQSQNSNEKPESYNFNQEQFTNEDFQTKNLTNKVELKNFDAKLHQIDPKTKAYQQFQEKYSKNSKKSSYDSKKEDLYNKRRNLEQDFDCPSSELYLAEYEKLGGNINGEIRWLDMMVRELDKTQFLTGIVINNGRSQRECIFGRVTRYGEINSFSFLKNSVDGQGQTECRALELTENNDLVVVGKAIGDDNIRTSALVMILDDDITSRTPLIKVWSNSMAWKTTDPVQEATDVATTADGGIFVTGFINSAFMQYSGTNHNDCFIMRLNYTLDVIWVKSYGTTGVNEECNSIQVTRNYDYIYLGGIRYTVGSAGTNMIFYKFDSYGDYGVGVQMNPANSETLTLKNILLTQKKQFSGIDDNNDLYFCGRTSANTGDIIVGRVTSSLVAVGQTTIKSAVLANTNAVIQITVAFRYGSPSYEDLGDCVLTDDNAYMIVLMNTRHQVDRRGTYAGSPIAYTYTYPAQNVDYLNDPYNGCATCYWPTSTYVPSHHSNIIKYCEDNFYNQFTAYVEDYNDNDIYSWTTCDFYTFYWNNIDCRIADLKFPACNRWSGDQITSIYVATGLACDFPISWINNDKPWYTSGCKNDQFKKNAFQQIFGNYTGTNAQKIYPYMFCDDNNIVNPGNAACGYDYFEFLFEQDCTDDGNRGNYNNWMILKFDLSTTAFSAANLNNIPEAAAYFGDRDGHLTGFAMAVDEFGFIYLHGSSDSQLLAADGNEIVWIHAKTHWKLTWEMRWNNTNSGWDSWRSYLGRRFVEPKKFKNSQNPFNPSTGATYNFAHNYLSESSRSYNFWDSDPINERIFDYTTLLTQTSFVNNYMADQGYPTQVTIYFGASQVSMNQFFTLTVAPVSSYTYSFNLPNLCQQDIQGQGGVNQTYRQHYETKVYQNGGAVAGLSFNLFSNDVSSQNYLQGTVSAAEGIYYSWYQGNSYSQYWNIYGTTPVYDCPYGLYRWFMDNDQFNSLKRYQLSYRVKIIVDDPRVMPPENYKNIPDLTPVVGQRYEFSVNGYFTTNCQYYKAKRHKLITGDTSTTSYNSTMLPYWLHFYEQNNTFVMYAVDTSSYHIDLFCCNNLNQCVSNTFTITPKDTVPVSTFGSGISPYVIQYDAYGGVGQYFNWAMTNLYFTDADTTTDTTDDEEIYHHTDHTVQMDFINAVASGFDSVQWMGLLFGQAYSTNVGTRTITYRYEDNHWLSNFIQATFRITINTQPSPNNIGFAYTFGLVDPTEGWPTTYFDKIYPWVKDDFSNILNVFTGTWFTDPDGDVLTYECTMSDGTDRPDWIGYDVTTGELRGYPNVSDSSILLNLKFTAYDTKNGYYTYHKTMLVNVVPRPVVVYTVITTGKDRLFSYYFGDLVKDIDGDHLNFYLLNPADRTELQALGVDYYSTFDTLTGRPWRTGTFTTYTLQAEDVHGYTTKIYFTLIVKDFMPDRRENVKGGYPDQELIEGQQFSFVLNNELFYDPQDEDSLVLFATTPYDRPLPDWLKFDPKSRSFYGVPDEVTTFKVQIRAMNERSHDSRTTEFRITVIPNSTPKTVAAEMSDDIIVYQYDWFEQTASYILFKDYETNKVPTLEIQNSSQQSLPSWVQFNHVNRTIFGIAKEVGVYDVDYVWTDDGGKKTYQNIRITVLPIVTSRFKTINLNYVVAMFTYGGLFIYLAYMIHYNIAMWKTSLKDKKMLKSMKQATKRFDEYQEVEVFFDIPNYLKLRPFKKGLQKPVAQITKDFKFTQFQEDPQNNMIKKSNKLQSFDQEKISSSTVNQTILLNDTQSSINSFDFMMTTQNRNFVQAKPKDRVKVVE